ncbi:MAG: DUF4468 domain-containing protein [Piscinibacter sp.]|jgi:hypothetical protein|uniref:DUF4468 domain-containing protein n=1 Tax=Piscinibacter sp. TaxID=1903157 RepID=UPI0011DC0439|nr:MAG: DUF4468 domain-containing protein [Burkholderiaceae bacterium]
MKRRAAIVALVVLSAPGLAQDAFVVEVIRDFEMPRDRLFDTALLWLAESSRSSKSVIDLKDKELGTIIGNGTSTLGIAWGVNVPMSFKLKIDVKDNKYRLTFSQVQLNFDYGLKPIEQSNRASVEPKARQQFEEVAASFHAYLTANAKAKAW